MGYWLFWKEKTSLLPIPRTSIQTLSLGLQEREWALHTGAQESLLVEAVCHYMGCVLLEVS